MIPALLTSEKEVRNSSSIGIKMMTMTRMTLGMTHRYTDNPALEYCRFECILFKFLPDETERSICLSIFPYPLHVTKVSNFV